MRRRVSQPRRGPAPPGGGRQRPGGSCCLLLLLLVVALIIYVALEAYVFYPMRNKEKRSSTIPVFSTPCPPDLSAQSPPFVRGEVGAPLLDKEGLGEVVLIFEIESSERV